MIVFHIVFASDVVIIGPHAWYGVHKSAVYQAKETRYFDSHLGDTVSMRVLHCGRGFNVQRLNTGRNTCHVGDSCFEIS